MTDDQPTIIVSPIDFAHTLGSVVITADCGHESWISPGGIETQARLNARTMCMRCVEPEQITSDQWEVTPEVYRDLVAEIGQVRADKIIELSKDPKMRALVFGMARRRR